MYPILQPLSRPIADITGIGPRYGKLLTGLCGPTIRDLLWHLPSSIIDRRKQPQISELKKYADQTVTLLVDIIDHAPPPKRSLPYKVIARDDSGMMEIVFFHARGNYWIKMLPSGQKRVISGKIDRYQSIPQMIHPDHIGYPNDLAKIKIIEPVYPLTHGIGNKTVRKAIASTLSKLPDLPEWLDAAMITQRAWPTWANAIRLSHAPQSDMDIIPQSPARQRLAYDEILSHQLALTLVRQLQRRAEIKRPMGNHAEWRQKLLAILPFELTAAQQSAMTEIDADMSAGRPMLRLLQGDVGSGKTIVALMTMLNAIAVKKQAAIMAPTEILARQHLATMQPLCEKLGLKIAALTGRDKGKAKQSIIQSIENGDADIIIGTHALLEDTVTFRNLGCVVIDEQHRFGVEQRLGLSQKHNAIDTLVMTATPIPRSLFLATYGDLDCSRLMEKPPGRKPIDTRTISLDRMDDVVAGIGRAINEGRQIYWVCPLVEESEQLDLAAATERFEQLSAHFPGKVGLVHGRLKAKDKERVMQDFAAAKISLLVATTVIEVGVNVPAASIMVIDHAQRFGLSQLHQLRGRVGRGHEQSRCLLLYSHALSETARARLAIMRDTEDGFRIAEEDLKLRGAGEILGTKQSGLPDMRFANFLLHQDLFKTAAAEVKWILDKDPMLQTPRGENLRLLLQLFGRHEAVNYLLSG